MALKNKVVKGFIWTSGEKFFSLFLRLFMGIILLRYLAPEDFGLIAMLTAFSLIAYSIVDSGFSQALIRKQDADDLDYNSTFYLNIAIAVLLYILFVSLSHPIAMFYSTPALSRFVPWLFLTIPVNTLGLIQTTIMTKKMDFKTLSMVNVVAVIISSVVVIIFAAAGFGPWSIIIQLLTLDVIKTSLLWIKSDWRPSLCFSVASVKGLFGFGSRLFATGMINQLFNNIMPMIIGKAYNPVQVGLYSQSLKLKESIVNSISVQHVTFPAFSAFQDDDAKLKLAGRDVIRVLSFLLFPAMAGLIAIGPEGFTLAGGEKWVPAIPYFQIFCITGFFVPLMNVSYNLLKAKGYGNLILSLEIVKKTFALAAIVVAATVSVKAMAWAYVAWIGFETAVNLLVVRKKISYGFREQLADTLPYLLMSGIMFLCVWAAGMLFSASSLGELFLLKMFTGMIVYTLLAWVTKPKAWFETVNIIRAFLEKIKH